MRANSVFKAVVEQSMECIPLLEIVHTERVGSVDYLVSHNLRRNVFTEFDETLSRHLAAVDGTGFPEISASLRIAQVGGDNVWQRSQSGTYASLSQALRVIAERAVGESGTADVRMSALVSRRPMDALVVEPRPISEATLGSITAALEFCRELGPDAFIEISGDFDMIVVRPADEALNPTRIDLAEGTVMVPLPDGGEVKGPLHGMRRHMSAERGFVSYMARARHALDRRRQTAVHAFRASAEIQVLELDRALGRGPITDYRVDAVQSLVLRLKAGLGDGLRGLAEHAKITALDWADAIEHGRRPEPRDVENKPIQDRKEAAAGSSGG